MAGTLQLNIVINAHNNMQGAIKNAQTMVRSLGNTIKAEAQASSRQVWLAGLMRELDQAKQKLKELQDMKKEVAGGGGSGTGLDYTEKLGNLGEGLNKIGLSLMAPVLLAVEEAAKFEHAMKKVEIAAYDGTIPLKEHNLLMQQLTDQAQRLGQETGFTDIDAAKAQRELFVSGMDAQVVLSGGTDGAMYLAQVAEMAPEAAAKGMASVAKIFSLTGPMFKQGADDINRAAQASSANVQDLFNNLQTSGMAAKSLGLEAKETSLLLATLHNQGLGSQAGSGLNNLLLKLNETTPETRKALNDLGLVQGAKFKQTSGVKLQMLDPGQSTLLNAKGEIESAEAMVQSLRQMFPKNQVDISQMVDAKGNLLPQEEIDNMLGGKKMNEILGLLRQSFGEEGMRTIVALASIGKGSYEETAQAAEGAMALEKQVQELQQTAIGLFEQLKGAWDKLKTSAGNPVLDELKALLKMGIQALEWLNNWTKAHPQATQWIIRLAAGLGAVTLIVGGLATALAPVLGSLFLTGIVLNKTGEFARKYGSILKNLGGSVLEFSAKLARMGITALLTGVRLALAWLIGLGPVGWIILGVSAVIAAAVAAWETNFMGFRDKVLGIWEKIKEVFGKIQEFFGFKGTATIQLNTGENTGGMPNAGSVPNISAAIPMVPNVPKTIFASTQDNRQNNFYIKSTDPTGAGREVASALNTMDKYKFSRDPRLEPAYPV